MFWNSTQVVAGKVNVVQPIEVLSTQWFFRAKLTDFSVLKQKLLKVYPAVSHACSGNEESYMDVDNAH